MWAAAAALAAAATPQPPRTSPACREEQVSARTPLATLFQPSFNPLSTLFQGSIKALLRLARTWLTRGLEHSRQRQRQRQREREREREKTDERRGADTGVVVGGGGGGPPDAVSALWGWGQDAKGSVGGGGGHALGGRGGGGGGGGEVGGGGGGGPQKTLDPDFETPEVQFLRLYYGSIDALLIAHRALIEP